MAPKRSHCGRQCTRIMRMRVMRSGGPQTKQCRHWQILRRRVRTHWQSRQRKQEEKQRRNPEYWNQMKCKQL